MQRLCIVRFGARTVSSVLALLLLLAGAARAEDTPRHRATLRGIAALSLVIEDVDPEAETDGLTRRDLQAEVESQLRRAGIPVLPGTPEHLYVNVNAMKRDNGLYAYAISVEFKQMLSLVREPQTTIIAPTWSVGAIGTGGALRLHEVRAAVAALVDSFIQVYREQNPAP